MEPPQQQQQQQPAGSAVVREGCALSAPQLSRVGLKARVSATLVPDVVYTAHGTTVAALLPAPATTATLDDPELRGRLGAAARTFRHVALLLPVDCGPHPLVIGLARGGSSGGNSVSNVAVLFYTTGGGGDDATWQALIELLDGFAQALSEHSSAAVDELRRQVASSLGCEHALRALPPLGAVAAAAALSGDEARRLAAAGGALARVASMRATDMTRAAGLPRAKAKAVEAFFSA